MRIWTDKTVQEEFDDLGDLGFTGNYNDRQFAYLVDQGYSGSLADMIAQADGSITYTVSIGTGAFTSGTELTATVSTLQGGETVTYQWTDDGANITGATSSTYTPTIGVDSVADASAINVSVTVDGGDPITATNREVRYAAGSGGADLDLSYEENSAITPQDLTANWTATNLTLTYVSVSPSLPAGLSINSSGTLSGTPTSVTADNTYTLTMQDQYGREISDTFTLEITAAASSTPTAFTFINSVDNTSGTFSTTPIGTAASDRDVYVFTYPANGSTPPTGCTVGGVSATLLQEEQLGTSAEWSQLWVATVTTGTTADIVFSGGNSTDYGIAVFAAYGRTGVSAKAVGSGSTVTLDANTTTGDDVIAAAFNRNGLGWSWTGLTEDGEYDVRTNEWFSAASALNVTGETPRAVSATQGSTGNSTGMIVVLT